VKIYLAGPLGFSEPGREYLYGTLIPRLVAAGFEVLDPWAAGGAIATAAAMDPGPERQEALASANAAAARWNADAIDAADAVLAVLDGADVDSGTAAEIGWAAARRTPVVGWRTDVRLAGDNEAATVNLQVQHFIERSGGDIERDLTSAMGRLSDLASP
jgi:nucleoside 2-deoxyribosyltransferase